jgi:hypothetical protein
MNERAERDAEDRLIAEDYEFIQKSKAALGDELPY